MNLSRPIARISAHTGADVLVLGATALDLDFLPPLRDLLNGRQAAPLDVVLFSRGGSVGAAYRIALMLRAFAAEIRFIVPDRCESAATALVLSGDGIMAGRASIFTPIDPSIHGDAESANTAGAVSAEDVRLFPAMTQAWFDLDGETAKRTALEILSRRFFPPTLTALYRAMEEVRSLARDLIGLGGADPASRESTIEALLSGYHSHSYPITRERLVELGLPIRIDDELEDLAWPVASALRQQLGPGSAEDVEQGWCDAILAFGGYEVKRKRDLNGRAWWEAVACR